MHKVLIVEDEQDVREVMAFVLRSRLSVETSEADSGPHAIELLKKDTKIDLVVSDYKMPGGDADGLFEYLNSCGKKIPFILCSSMPPDQYRCFQEKPVAGFVLKPDIFKPLVELVSRVFSLKPAGSDSAPTGYCSVPISLLLRFGTLKSDVYLKLNDDKYIKVFLGAEAFDQSDFERFKVKDVDNLYIRKSECHLFLENIVTGLVAISNSKDLSVDVVYPIAESAAAIISRAYTEMGFTEQTRKLATTAVNLTVKSILSEPETANLFKPRFAVNDGYIPAHSTALAYVACGLASYMGWVSEVTFAKLCLAALLHDITLSNSLAPIQDLSDLALHSAKLSEEEHRQILEHPTKAAELIASMKNTQPDADVIVRMHHERPDGSGFPQGLEHSKVTPLAAVFIIAHGMVMYMMGHGENADVSGYLNGLDESYQKEPFKKILRLAAESLA